MPDSIPLPQLTPVDAHWFASYVRGDGWTGGRMSATGHVYQVTARENFIRSAWMSAQRGVDPGVGRILENIKNSPHGYTVTDFSGQSRSLWLPGGTQSLPTAAGYVGREGSLVPTHTTLSIANNMRNSVQFSSPSYDPFPRRLELHGHNTFNLNRFTFRPQDWYHGPNTEGIKNITANLVPAWEKEQREKAWAKMLVNAQGQVANDNLARVTSAIPPVVTNTPAADVPAATAQVKAPGVEGPRTPSAPTISESSGRFSELMRVGRILPAIGCAIAGYNSVRALLEGRPAESTVRATACVPMADEVIRAIDYKTRTPGGKTSLDPGQVEKDASFPPLEITPKFQRQIEHTHRSKPVQPPL